MLSLAELTKDESLALLRSQTAGVFFDEMPMRNYGGTPLSYACVFDLRKAVKKFLDTGLVSLNDRNGACERTGFMPIHAVVANGLTETYDWLAELPGMPAYKRAKVDQRTQVGRMRLNAHGLPPANLAAKLGDHRTCKYILKKQTSILWVWGPVTQHSINLAGIDSAGEGGGDIMELLARLDAKRETTELVLDSFMTGFLYKLFALKWKSYGMKLYYARLAIDVIVCLMLVAISFILKEAASPAAGMHTAPLQLSTPWQRTRAAEAPCSISLVPGSRRLAEASMRHSNGPDVFCDCGGAAYLRALLEE